jgi:hypothetical protein
MMDETTNRILSPFAVSSGNHTTCFEISWHCCLVGGSFFSVGPILMKNVSGVLSTFFAICDRQMAKHTLRVVNFDSDEKSDRNGVI